MDKTSPTAKFTSSVFPGTPGLKGSCNLPLGFMISPMAKTTDIQCLNEQDMHLCLTCGAYLNLYTLPEKESGVWICCICEATNVAPTSNPQVLQSPIIEFRQRAAGTDNDITIDTSYCEKTSKSATMIVIDANIPPVEVKAILKELASLKLENVGLVIFSKMIHVYQIGLKGIASADIYSPTLNPTDAGDDVTDRLYFGTMDEVGYCADAFFGTSSLLCPTLADNKKSISRKEMLKINREARLSKEIENCNNRFDAFDPSKTAKLLKEARQAKQHASHRKLTRCTLEAVLYAVHMMRILEFQNGQVLLFTNGCCNLGQGSIVIDNDHIDDSSHADTVDFEKMQTAAELMRSLGADAFEVGVGIDVFCSGNSFLGTQGYLGLVKSSGGYVLSHTSFDDASFQRDVSYVCTETHMSRAVSSSSNVEETIQRMASPDRMNMLNGVVMDVRMPDYVIPKLMQGPGIIIHDSQFPLPNERAAFASCSALTAERGLPTHNLPSLKTIDMVLMQIQMGRLDATSSISVIVQTERSLPEHSFVHFQFVTRYIETNNLVTRVSTHRMPVSNDNTTFFQSVNIEMTSVLLGKEAAFRSMALSEKGKDDVLNIALSQQDIESRTCSSQSDLASTAHDIIKAYNSLQK